jgi:hypothetical protein
MFVARLAVEAEELDRNRVLVVALALAWSVNVVAALVVIYLTQAIVTE